MMDPPDSRRPAKVILTGPVASKLPEDLRERARAQSRETLRRTSDLLNLTNPESLTDLNMAQTRSDKSSPQSSPPASSPPASKKRAAKPGSSEPPRKRGRPSNASKKEKEQKTIEETLNNGDGVEDDAVMADEVEDKNNTNGTNGTEDGEKNAYDEMKNGAEKAGKEEKDEKDAKETLDHAEEQVEDDKDVAGQINGDDTSKDTNGLKNGEKNAFDEVKGDTTEVKQAAKEEQDLKTEEITKNNNSVVKDSEREAAIPSSILEKGIIYFFFRPRVGIEDPQSLDDVARSYIVLRPLPIGAKLGEGPLEDSGNARLLALPKKQLPKSKSDRFLMFVEKPKQYIKDIREQFEGNEYATKTSGTSNSPAAKPFAEGVYAITSTGRESHLAYVVTVPKEIGEVQKELGVNEKGSFVLSTKNPQAPGPANATLDNPAQYPSEIQNQFRNLRWTPTIPAHLDYEHTQFLIIGEGMGDTGNAMQEMGKDKKDDEKKKPEQELEDLEHEDMERVEGLKGDDPVFVDLGLSGKEFEGLSTTW